MNAILLGARSDIGKELAKRLHADGWTVWAWDRGHDAKMLPPWDLLIVAVGTLKPVAKFFDANWDDWRAGFESNALLPLQLVHALYPKRNANAGVLFFGGTNPYKANPHYSAYAAAKAALRMAVRDIGCEYQDLRVWMLDTGMVRTKIHEPTIEAGIYNERLERTGDETTHDMIYTALKKCLSNPIGKVRGNFFFVPHIV